MYTKVNTMRQNLIFHQIFYSFTFAVYQMQVMDRLTMQHISYSAGISRQARYKLTHHQSGIDNSAVNLNDRELG